LEAKAAKQAPDRLSVAAHECVSRTVASQLPLRPSDHLLSRSIVIFAAQQQQMMDEA